MIKCLLTELGRAGRENIWPLVMAYGPSCARSLRHDLRPSHSVNKYILSSSFSLCTAILFQPKLYKQCHISTVLAKSGPHLSLNINLEV